MTFEEKKDYLLSEINQDYCYEFLSKSTGMTIEGILLKIFDEFYQDLSYGIENKILFTKSYEDDSLTLELSIKRYSKFLIYMHRYFVKNLRDVPDEIYIMCYKQKMQYFTLKMLIRNSAENIFNDY